MSVYKKLLEARKIIREHGVSKDGNNKFANYNYFTPDGVKAAVGGACQLVGIIPIFSLDRDDLGLFGRLRIVDVESNEDVEFRISTAIPEIKATNVTQQVGGCITYTERYALMVAFEIADNKADFDAHDNSGGGEAMEVRPFIAPKKIHNSADPKVKPKEALVQPDNKSAVDHSQRDIEDQIAEEESKKADAKVEASELDKLKIKCDELGIKYSGRHKESGLQKLIDEFHAKAGKADATDPVRSYSAEEEEAVEEVKGKVVWDDNAVDMALNEYQKMIDSYEDHVVLKDKAPALISGAEQSGMPDEYMAELKAMINDKYTELRDKDE